MEFSATLNCSGSGNPLQVRLAASGKGSRGQRLEMYASISRLQEIDWQTRGLKRKYAYVKTNLTLKYGSVIIAGKTLNVLYPGLNF